MARRPHDWPGRASASGHGSAEARPAPLLRELFPPGVVAYELRGPGSLDALLPEERQWVERASPKRAHEFAAGRICAHAALAQLGLRGQALGVGPDRTPQWPRNVCGSIAHSAGYCAAVVAERGRFRSLGLDVERVAAMTPDVEPQICAPPEAEWLTRLAAPERQKVATLMFSAKEAFYKCQYPLTRQWLEFDDVTLDLVGWDLDAGSFAVRPVGAVKLLDARPLPWFGTFRFGEGLVFTSFGLTA